MVGIIGAHIRRAAPIPRPSDSPVEPPPPPPVFTRPPEKLAHIVHIADGSFSTHLYILPLSPLKIQPDDSVLLEKTQRYINAIKRAVSHSILPLIELAFDRDGNAMDINTAVTEAALMAQQPFESRVKAIQTNQPKRFDSKRPIPKNKELTPATLTFFDELTTIPMPIKDSKKESFLLKSLIEHHFYQRYFEAHPKAQALLPPNNHVEQLEDGIGLMAKQLNDPETIQRYQDAFPALKEIIARSSNEWARQTMHSHTNNKNHQAGRQSDRA